MTGDEKRIAYKRAGEVGAGRRLVRRKTLHRRLERRDRASRGRGMAQPEPVRRPGLGRRAIVACDIRPRNVPERPQGRLQRGFDRDEGHPVPPGWS